MHRRRRTTSPSSPLHCLCWSSSFGDVHHQLGNRMHAWVAPDHPKTVCKCTVSAVCLARGICPPDHEHDSQHPHHKILSSVVTSLVTWCAPFPSFLISNAIFCLDAFTLVANYATLPLPFIDTHERLYAERIGAFARKYYFSYYYVDCAYCAYWKTMLQCAIEAYHKMWNDSILHPKNKRSFRFVVYSMWIT